MAEPLIFPGAPFLLRALRQLSSQAAAEILEQAVVAGADRVRARAAELAPRGNPRRRPGTKALADTIRVHVAEKDRAHALVQVGTKSAYAHLVEYGHQVVGRGPGRGALGPDSLRRRQRTGALGARGQKITVVADNTLRGRLRRALQERRSLGSIGFVAPRPFMRPAIDETQQQAIADMATVLGRGVAVSLQRSLSGAPGIEVRVA